MTNDRFATDEDYSDSSDSILIEGTGTIGGDTPRPRPPEVPLDWIEQMRARRRPPTSDEKGRQAG